VTHRYPRVFLCFVSLVTVGALVTGCAAGRANGRGESAARGGNWDLAVEHFRRAVQEDPGHVAYQIALERAMINASVQHLDQARLLEAREQLEDALREYRRASEFDPSNRQIAGKVGEIERRIRDLAEASRPQPTIQQLQQSARQNPEPLLNPASREPIDIVFNNASLRDILTSMGTSAGINVTFERDYQDLKRELGLGHYEGRGWRGFHHHATLCIAAYGFPVSERETILPSEPGGAPNLPKPAVPDGYRPRGAADPARAPHPGHDRHPASAPHGRPRKDPRSMSVLQRSAKADELLSTPMTQ